jgi:parvulin-like peptidyl-prolyl isomerase
MTLRSTQKPSSGRPVRVLQDPEDRFQQWVTLGFVGLIVAVAVIVVGALAYGYWDANFRGVASVNGESISRDQWRGRAALETFRLEREEGRIRTALAAGEIEQDEAAVQLQAVAFARQGVDAGSLERLIDLTLQSQLAAERGLAVTDAEVEVALDATGGTPERRRVSAVIVEPQTQRPGMAPTPAERQEAYRAAREAEAALEGGEAFETVVASHSTHESRDRGGDLGAVSADDERDPAWTAALFELPVGGVTPLLEAADGSYRIGTVTEILPAEPDPVYRQEVEREVGAGVVRDNVRLELLAERLEESVVSGSLEGDVPQVRLAQILVEGDTFVPPEADEGQVRASHILYSPNDDPAGAAELPEDDPAWADAQAAAEAAADDLRAIDDPSARTTAFAQRAATESDDQAAAQSGGDLGYFSREQMVPEFADPLFEAEDLRPGDIVGPVRSSFGWHVIMFADRTPPLGERLEEVRTRLAADGADFATVAAEMSDGPEAPFGGELGWRRTDGLDDSVAVAVLGLDPGEVTEPVAQDDGYHIYQLLETAQRPLDGRQRAEVQASAFEDWYEERRAEAEDEGRITRDAGTVAL